MKTEVLLERLPDRRYRATGTAPFALTVDGDTREEALANFQRAAWGESSETTPLPAEVVTLQTPEYVNGAAKPEDPLAQFVGIGLRNPLYSLFLEQMERNREQDNAEGAATESDDEQSFLPDNFHRAA